MRQHLDPAGATLAPPRFDNQPGAVLPDSVIDRNVGVGDLAGPHRGGGKPAAFRYLGQRPSHLGEGPAQIDGGRSGRGQL